jgi:hypothetical protein
MIRYYYHQSSAQSPTGNLEEQHMNFDKLADFQKLIVVLR